MASRAATVLTAAGYSLSFTPLRVHGFGSSEGKMAECDRAPMSGDALEVHDSGGVAHTAHNVGAHAHHRRGHTAHLQHLTQLVVHVHLIRVSPRQTRRVRVLDARYDNRRRRGP
jgi:hypothetical protein